MSVNRMINQPKVAVSVTGPVLPDRLVEMNLYFRWLRFTNYLRYKSNINMNLQPAHSFSQNERSRELVLE